jgi:hypothetical protein
MPDQQSQKGNLWAYQGISFYQSFKIASRVFDEREGVPGPEFDRSAKEVYLLKAITLRCHPLSISGSRPFTYSRTFLSGNF